MSNTGYNGQNDPGAGGEDWGAIATIARRMMLEIVTTKPVIVRAVRNNGALAEAGFIDVQPMVNQVDGEGNPTPHEIIYNIPYIRMQGGANAIIMDPEVGDRGVCGFCTHDISAVKTTKDIANPSSGRRFDHADGVYLGGMLNGIPIQYIQFNSTGITIATPNGVFIEAESTIDGSLNVTGNVTVGNGASGTFTSLDGLTVTVQDGIITNIY